jgi:hypothetical protein
VIAQFARIGDSSPNTTTRSPSPQPLPAGARATSGCPCIGVQRGPITPFAPSPSGRGPRTRRGARGSAVQLFARLAFRAPNIRRSKNQPKPSNYPQKNSLTALGEGVEVGPRPGEGAILHKPRFFTALRPVVFSEESRFSERDFHRKFRRKCRIQVDRLFSSCHHRHDPPPRTPTTKSSIAVLSPRLISPAELPSRVDGGMGEPRCGLPSAFTVRELKHRACPCAFLRAAAAIVKLEVRNPRRRAMSTPKGLGAEEMSNESGANGGPNRRSDAPAEQSCGGRRLR